MNMTRFLKQKAVYWASPTPSGFGGYTHASPVEIDVRWEDKQELFTDSTGKQALSRAVVCAGQDLQVGGYLYLGRLTDLDSSGLPTQQSGAYEIRAFNKIPSLDGTWYMREAWL